MTSRPLCCYYPIFLFAHLYLTLSYSSLSSCLPVIHPKIPSGCLKSQSPELYRDYIFAACTLIFIFFSSNLFLNLCDHSLFTVWDGGTCHLCRKSLAEVFIETSDGKSFRIFNDNI